MRDFRVCYGQGEGVFDNPDFMPTIDVGRVWKFLTPPLQYIIPCRDPLNPEP